MMTPSDPFQSTGANSPQYEADAYEIRRAETLEGILPRGTGGRALDIGCGPGYFSRMLRDRGWQVVGIDAETVNIERACAFVVETHQGDARTVLPALPGETFELVCALEIIEHMAKQDGVALIEQVNRVLKPGATLIISTPNRWSLEGLGDYYWGEKIRGWRRWDAWNVTHVHIYSSLELRRALRAGGFVMDRLVGYWYRGTLPGGINVRLPFDSMTRFPLNHFGFNTIVSCHKR
ncbi:MAG: class I SAM-dependent methyltransferase [Polyangiaceae bacterium]|nr:class I SAM-dependent methyltransferase [Polyangiaceae bacterium]